MIGKSYLIGITAILAFVYLLSVNGTTNTNTYTQWKAHFGIQISSEQDSYRQKIFMDNLAMINEHNSKVGKQYTMGINAFAHLTKQEFAAKYLDRTIEVPEKTIVINNQQINQDEWIDWRARGAVTPVKTQGSCSASYAFASVGAVEGYNQIMSHRLYEYSNQQVVDCSRSQGNGGCQGGSIINSFNYIKESGLTYRSTYPYHGYDGPCMNPPTQIRINQFSQVSDCNSLYNALTKNPVAVMVDGSNMQFYHGGIFTNCGTSLSYNLLLVGSTQSYWELKSSWGPSWGEGGYIRIPKGNSCGVCQIGAYPSGGW